MNSFNFKIISIDNYQYDYINLDVKYLRTKQKSVCIYLDSLLLHYFIKELILNDFYRNSFIKFMFKWNVIPTVFILKPTTYDTIDYKWNEKVSYLVRERCEIDHTLSWLSTLGGAFSALGDYFEKCAHIAGKISIHQLQLAMKLDDPIISSRCRLYLSLSLIQKKRFKFAKQIIRNEYKFAKDQIEIDRRLERMCRGIWAKLQYEYDLYRNCRKLNKC